MGSIPAQINREASTCSWRLKNHCFLWILDRLSFVVLVLFYVLFLDSNWASALFRIGLYIWSRVCLFSQKLPEMICVIWFSVWSSPLVLMVLKPRFTSICSLTFILRFRDFQPIFSSNPVYISACFFPLFLAFFKKNCACLFLCFSVSFLWVYFYWINLYAQGWYNFSTPPRNCLQTNHPLWRWGTILRGFQVKQTVDVFRPPVSHWVSGKVFCQWTIQETIKRFGMTSFLPFCGGGLSQIPLFFFWSLCVSRLE